jgi:glyoxylase-like metal-dependent hydrolase (beta-lactamase superfamily II)
MFIDSVRACTRNQLTFVLVLALCSYPGTVSAQENPYSNTLLASIRAAAKSVPGPRPRELRYIGVAETRAPLSSVVAVADTQQVSGAFPAFQIRFANRWIMVDAALDSSAMIETYGPGGADGFAKARYDSLQLALRDADLIVLTHEHPDHANGVQRGAYFKQIAAKTLLNSAQYRWLLSPPASPDSTSLFRAVEYDLLYPLAPGVVLVRAPGHSPGSQFVYVQLADGREILLLGDVVWSMVGLTANAQKPQPVSDYLKEDRVAIQREMDWVRSIMSSIAVVPSHDQGRLDALVRQGLLHVGLDIRRN